MTGVTASRRGAGRTVDVALAAMRARHLNSVLRIERSVYPTPWSRALFLTEMTLRATRSYYVACVGGAVVGYGGVLFAGEDAHVSTLAVDPRWQREKVATRLLLQLTASALAHGIVRATLEVRATNRAAQRLYARFGYAPVGVRKGYYRIGATSEDAIIMTADRIDTPLYRDRLRAVAASVPGRTTVDDKIPW